MRRLTCCSEACNAPRVEATPKYLSVDVSRFDFRFEFYWPKTCFVFACLGQLVHQNNVGCLRAVQVEQHTCRTSSWTPQDYAHSTDSSDAGASRASLESFLVAGVPRYMSVSVQPVLHHNLGSRMMLCSQTARHVIPELR